MSRFPSYTILPAEGGEETVISTDNPSMLLALVARLDTRSADVVRDGVYFCSLRLDENGVWAIAYRNDIRPGDSWPSADLS